MNSLLAGKPVVPAPVKDPVPGHSKKVTCVDYEEKGGRDKDCRDCARPGEIHDESDPDEREAKRREVAVVPAKDQAEKEPAARQPAEPPAAVTRVVPKIPIVPTPKQQPVPEVVRRSR